MSLEIPRGTPKEQIYAGLDKIGREKFGFELKPPQRYGAAQLLRGKDVLLLMETGGGKSALFGLFAHARPKEIALVISPLKMLEKNMVERLEQKGLRAIGLNADAVEAARREGRDLWDECKQGRYQVILCSPERLASEEMGNLISHPEFRDRVGLVVVDEAHLIGIWGGKVSGGKPFRAAYNAIGTLKSRLSPRTVFLALSATLMPGKPLEIVEETLGFVAGDRYRPIMLDCERKNLHLTLRRINHPISNGTFADLDWLLNGLPPAHVFDPSAIPKTVIYVDNITRGDQLTSYLRNLLPEAFKLHKHRLIRHLHASTCVKCKDEIMNEFSNTHDAPLLRIVIATEAFGCGIDIPDIERVINLGTPRNLDSAYQRLGRAGRGLEKGWGIIYVGSRLWDSVENPKVRDDEADSLDEDDAPKNCEHFKRLLLAQIKGKCLSACIQGIYSHQTSPPIRNRPNMRCMRCSACLGDPALNSHDDTPEGDSNASAKESKKRKRAPRPTTTRLISKSDNRGRGRMPKSIIDPTREELATIILRVSLSARTRKTKRFDTLETFITDAQSRLLMKYIRDFETIESIRTVLGEDWPYWDSHGVVFSNAILDLRERVLAALEANHGVLDDEVDDEEDDMLDIPEEEVVASRQCENGHHLNTEHNQPRLIIRIPPRATINASQNVPDEYGMNTT